MRQFKIMCVGVCILLFSQLRAQNVYDTYNPKYAPSYDSIVTRFVGDTAYWAFTGEYEIFDFLLGAWENVTPSFPTYTSYKIEPVSFPFRPDCSNGDCGNASSTTRKLVLEPNYQYGDFIYAHPFSGIQGEHATLLTNFFTATAPPGGQRDFLPHTILKHTVYLHYGTPPSAPVIDSLVFILDHTRGYMSQFPFRNDNDQSTPSQHDVTVFPWFVYCDNDSFLTIPVQGANFLGTPDYYPYPDVNYYPNAIIPNWAQIPDPVAGTPYIAPTYYTHPSPFTLVAVMLANSHFEPFAGVNDDSLLGGIPHTYYIDTAMDLKTINPHERIIYNPSAVYITAADPVVFPSGYTFKTVGALYASQAQIEALDPDTMYANLRDVPITGSALNLTDNPNTYAIDSLSYYIVTAGCTLRIESCVTIYDAIIVVQNGGRLEMDTNNVFGNYELQIIPGGTLVQQSSPQDVPCRYICYESSHYNQRHVTISSNTTWDTTNIESAFPGTVIWSAASNNTVKLVEGITIDSGATLTIGPGVTLLFGPEAKVVIKKGGRLIANGTSAANCHFGPACQLEWQGIQVWGDTAISQHPPNGNTPQGLLELHYSIVDHARDAVTLGEPGFVHHNGGVIDADHCSFLNNVRDLVFQPYRNFNPNNPSQTAYNISHLNANEFRTTEYFFDPTLNEQDGSPRAATAHIVLQDVKFRFIYNCTFSTDNPENYAPHLRGIGIFGIETSLWLQSQGPNHFENLSDGVWMQGTGQSATAMNLTAQVFVNNIHSIICEGTRYSSIFKNQIDVPESPQYGYQPEDLELGYDKPVGVFMLGAIDYRIEENEFNVGDSSGQITPNAACDNCNYDIVIYNTSWPFPPYAGSGTIYKNEIHHASIGIQAQGNNGSGNIANYGAEFMCNDFEDRVFHDFLLVGRGWSPSAPAVQSTIRDQGVCNGLYPSLKATNFFEACDFPVDSQVYYDVSNTVNFYYADRAITYPGCYNINPIFCNPFDGPNPCASKLTGRYWSVIVVRYITARTAYEAARHTLDSLVDGGDTEAMLGYIEGLSGNDLFDKLNNASPWLSDVALLAILDPGNRTKITSAQMTTILLANGRLSPEVYAEVLNIGTSYFSDTELEDIANDQTDIGPREQLEREWRAWLLAGDIAASDIVEYAISTDSLATGITQLLGAKPVAEMQKLFTLQLAAREFDDAETTLDNILIEQDNVETFWTTLAAISLQQAQENRSWLTATFEEIHIADSIWAEHGDEAICTRVAVAYYTGQGFQRSPFPLEESEERLQNPNQRSSVLQTPVLGVYPNPATNSATVVVQGPLNGSATVEVVNAMGQVVDRISIKQGENAQLDLSQYPTGILYLRLLSEGECVDTEKLVILK